MFTCVISFSVDLNFFFLVAPRFGFFFCPRKSSVPHRSFFASFEGLSSLTMGEDKLKGASWRRGVTLFFPTSEGKKIRNFPPRAALQSHLLSTSEGAGAEPQPVLSFRASSNIYFLHNAQFPIHVTLPRA